MSEETITLKRAELEALLEQAAQRGAELADEKREALEKEALDTASKTADELDRSWRETVRQMSRVEIIPDKDRVLSINGYRVMVKRLLDDEGEPIPVKVPIAYADQYRQALADEAEVERLRAAMRQAYQDKATGKVPIKRWNGS